MPNLFSLQAGGDVGVGLRVDVGIDAERRRARAGPVAARRASSALELRRRLDVEAAGCRPRARRASRLRSCRRRRTPSCRIAARREHARQLAARDDVEARAQAREQSQDGEIRVGLHRVADQVVAAGEWRGDGAEALLDRRRASRRSTGVPKRRRSTAAATSSAWRTPLRYWKGGHEAGAVSAFA